MCVPGGRRRREQEQRVKRNVGKEGGEKERDGQTQTLTLASLICRLEPSNHAEAQICNSSCLCSCALPFTPFTLPLSTSLWLLCRFLSLSLQSFTPFHSPRLLPDSPPSTPFLCASQSRSTHLLPLPILHLFSLWRDLSSYICFLPLSLSTPSHSFCRYS